jgi:subtilase family serine protease
LLTFFGLPFWGHADDPPPDQELTPTTIFEPIEEVQPNLIGPYNPSQIKTAYGFNRLPTANTGTGQKIAIIVAYGSPTLEADLAFFNQYYNLPPANLEIYYPTGQPTSTDQRWEKETSLDVQWAHALAPGATIQLVVAKTGNMDDLKVAVQYATDTLGAQVISMSWSKPETSTDPILYDSYFNKPGTVFVASSGDNGSDIIRYPATCPTVIAVGGTSLYLNPDWTV